MNEDAILLQRIDSLMDRIQAKIDDLQRSINAKIGWLPDWLRTQVLAGWDSFTSAMRDFWDFLTEIIHNMGSPSRLWETADAWADDVGSPMSGKAQTIAAALLRVDDQWDGAAADAYRQTLPLQSAALDKVRTALAEGASSALSDMARAICIFWGMLLAALFALIAGIVSALASSATIFGLPAAPFIACAAALVAVGTLSGGVLNLESTAHDANLKLRQKLADDSCFPNGRWPTAVRTLG